MHWMVGDWRSWTACHSMEVLNKPQWSLHRLAATTDGAVCVDARRCKEWTYPESRAQLVVLALEVGGRWLTESLAFIHLLARAKARGQTRNHAQTCGAGLVFEVAVALGCCGSSFCLVPCWNCAGWG